MDDINIIMVSAIAALIICITCGLIGYQIGNTRGRPCAGLWLGLLLGPLGCLGALFLPRDTPPARPSVRAAPASATRFCSLCGKHVDRYARNCPECGNAI